MKLKFDIREFLLNLMDRIQQKNWVLTVVFFTIIFVAALIIWKDCIWMPQPTQDTLRNILNTEAEYENRMKSIKENYDELRSRMDRFNNPKNNLVKDREYFGPSEIDIEINSISRVDPSNYNPKLIN